MGRKLWLVVLCAMVLSMLAVSCGGKTPETTGGATVAGKVVEQPASTTPASTQKPQTTTQAPSTTQQPAKTKASSVPIYGGTFTLPMASIVYWDFNLGNISNNFPEIQCVEVLLIGDWAKGLSGTGETGWQLGAYFPKLSLMTGCIAESWEVQDPVTYIFHIRKGIRFHNKPPTNGREVVAADVAWNITRMYDSKISPQAYIRLTAPGLKTPTQVTATDKYTVKVVMPNATDAPIFFEDVSARVPIYPPEVIQQYGDINDWRNNCGTGPFMVKDNLPDSSTLVIRNPDYWRNDPVNKNNKLPYLDAIKYLVFADLSTRQAALRTGKLDLDYGIDWETAAGIIKSNPELTSQMQRRSDPTVVAMRVDKKPFDDIRVRQAMTMAVNFNAILTSYYGGLGDIISSPITNIPDFSDMYIPLDKLPPNVQNLYGYHPDQAKKLLADAGYPNGFQANCTTVSTYIDYLSLLLKYWADIGVKVTLDVKETAAYTALINNKQHAELCARFAVTSVPFKMYFYRAGTPQNMAMFKDDKLEEAYVFLSNNYFDYTAKAAKFKTLIPYILEQCWYVYSPSSSTCAFWQPWVGGYNGENSVGYNVATNFIHYLWIDQALKKKMGK